jgi:quinol monooxygenase YgiN
MPHVTVVAKIVAKQEYIGSVRSELLTLITPTRNEEGCIDYTLHQDNDDPAVFVFYENWSSAAAIENHLNTPHYRAYARALDGLIEGKEVHKMTLVEPGSAL